MMQTRTYISIHYMLKLLFSYVNFLISRDVCNKENFKFRNQFRNFMVKLLNGICMYIYIIKKEKMEQLLNVEKRKNLV